MLFRSRRERGLEVRFGAKKGNFGSFGGHWRSLGVITWHYMGVYGGLWGYMGGLWGHTDPVEVQVCGPEEGAGPGGEIWGQKGRFWVLWGSLEVIGGHWGSLYGTIWGLWRSMGVYGAIWGSLGGYMGVFGGHADPLEVEP